MWKAFFAVLVCFAAGAVLAEPPAPAIATCNRVKVGQCVEYRKLDAQGLSAMKDACAKGDGDVWTEGKPCPKEKQLGHCALELLGSVTDKFFYPPATVASAKELCSMLGLEFVAK